MGEVTVAVKLTQKQAGALYIQYLKRGDRIDELKAGIREMMRLAEESGNSSIVEIATTLLKTKQTVPTEPM